MASVGWLFDPLKRAYKAVAGRIMGRLQLVKVRDTAADRGAAQMADLAAKAVRGEITADAFRAGLRTLVRNHVGSQYILGRGGIDAMAQSDVRTLSGLLREQFAYVEGFVNDVAAGLLTEAQAAARAELYAGAGSFDRGKAAAWGLDRALPEYPGDRCKGMSRCRCSWAFDETEDAIECTWRLGGSKPCEVCQANAQRYAPYVIPKRAARVDETPIRLAAVER